MSRTGTLVALFVILLSVLAPLAGLVPSAFADATATPTPLPKFHLHDPCALDPHNLVQNGSMAPGHNTPYGTAAANWEPVIYSSAAPQFNWVGNEQIDPNGAQQMFSVNPFDAAEHKQRGRYNRS